MTGLRKKGEPKLKPMGGHHSLNQDRSKGKKIVGGDRNGVKKRVSITLEFKGGMCKGTSAPSGPWVWGGESKRKRLNMTRNQIYMV